MRGPLYCPTYGSGFYFLIALRTNPTHKKMFFTIMDALWGWEIWLMCITIVSSSRPQTEKIRWEVARGSGSSVILRVPARVLAQPALRPWTDAFSNAKCPGFSCLQWPVPSDCILLCYLIYIRGVFFFYYWSVYHLIVNHLRAGSCRVRCFVLGTCTVPGTCALCECCLAVVSLLV